jgi:hypothetical protein
MCESVSYVVTHLAIKEARPQRMTARHPMVEDYMDEAIDAELDRRLLLLEKAEHQGQGIDRIAFWQIVVLCWLVPAVLLYWGA